MNSKPIKILSVDPGNEIENIVSGVFRSVHHKTHRCERLDEVEQAINKEHYDLLIIHNNGNKKIEPEAWKDLQYLRPNLTAILISSKSDDEIWKRESNVYVVKAEKLVTDLPLVLSTFYSRYGDQPENVLLRSHLLLNSLQLVKQGLIILNENGELLFLNPAAEKMLGINEERELNISFFDFVNDGEKIWRYFTSRNDSRSASAFTYCLFDDIEKIFL